MELQAGKVSIIVPVYNVEDYFPACAESLLSQDYGNMEILLIDDGSRDGSGALCDTYAARDARVRVIHQENGGPSAARNRGLAEATGEWIMFTDGDDRLMPGAVSAAVCAMVRTQADAVWFLHRVTEGKGTQIFPTVYCPPGDLRIYSGTRELFDLLYETGGAISVVWSKIYRRELFSQLRFTEGIQYEDEELTARLFSQMHTLAVMPCELYQYVKRPCSIINGYTAKNTDVFKVYDLRIELLRQLGFDDLIEKTYARYFFALVDLWAKNRKYGRPVPDSYFKQIYRNIKPQLRDIPQINSRFSALEKLMRISFGFIRFYALKRGREL